MESLKQNHFSLARRLSGRAFTWTLVLATVFMQHETAGKALLEPSSQGNSAVQLSSDGDLRSQTVVPGTHHVDPGTGTAQAGRAERHATFMRSPRRQPRDAVHVPTAGHAPTYPDQSGVFPSRTGATRHLSPSWPAGRFRSPHADVAHAVHAAPTRHLRHRGHVTGIKQEFEDDLSQLSNSQRESEHHEAQLSTKGRETGSHTARFHHDNRVDDQANKQDPFFSSEPGPAKLVSGEQNTAHYSANGLYDGTSFSGGRQSSEDDWAKLSNAERSGQRDRAQLFSDHQEPEHEKTQTSEQAQYGGADQRNLQHDQAHYAGRQIPQQSSVKDSSTDESTSSIAQDTWVIEEQGAEAQSERSPRLSEEANFGVGDADSTKADVSNYPQPVVLNGEDVASEEDVNQAEEQGIKDQAAEQDMDEKAEQDIAETAERNVQGGVAEQISADQETAQNTEDQETELNMAGQETAQNTKGQETELDMEDPETELNLAGQEKAQNTKDQETELDMEDPETELNMEDLETELNMEDQETEQNVHDQEIEQNIEDEETDQYMHDQEIEQNMEDEEMEQNLEDQAREQILAEEIQGEQTSSDGYISHQGTLTNQDSSSFVQDHVNQHDDGSSDGSDATFDMALGPNWETSDATEQHLQMDSATFQREETHPFSELELAPDPYPSVPLQSDDAQDNHLPESLDTEDEASAGQSQTQQFDETSGFGGPEGSAVLRPLGQESPLSDISTDPAGAATKKESPRRGTSLTEAARDGAGTSSLTESGPADDNLSTFYGTSTVYLLTSQDATVHSAIPYSAFSDGSHSRPDKNAANASK